VMMWVISVSLRPWAMAAPPRVEYNVTTGRITHWVRDSSYKRGCVSVFLCCYNVCYGLSHNHSHGKLYMKQACAAIIHSALVSQKMAMLH
jgi:hypothetical protein